MATQTIRPKGQRLQVGELNGQKITFKMLRTKENLPVPIAEFLAFLERVNRGSA